MCVCVFVYVCVCVCVRVYVCVRVCVCVCLIGQYETILQVWKMGDVQLVRNGKTERPSSAAES